MLSKPSDMMLLTIPGNPNDAELIEGLVLLKSPATAGMPSKLEGKVALIEQDLAPPQAQVTLNDPAKIAEIVEIQQKFIEHTVNNFVKHEVKCYFLSKISIQKSFNY